MKSKEVLETTQDEKCARLEELGNILVETETGTVSVAVSQNLFKHEQVKKLLKAE